MNMQQKFSILEITNLLFKLGVIDLYMKDTVDNTVFARDVVIEIS